MRIVAVVLGPYYRYITVLGVVGEGVRRINQEQRAINVFQVSIVLIT